MSKTFDNMAAAALERVWAGEAERIRTEPEFHALVTLSSVTLWITATPEGYVAIVMIANHPERIRMAWDGEFGEETL